MKILSVSSGTPYPPDHATRNRAWHFISRLAQVEELTVLTWYDPSTDPRSLEVLRGTVQRLVAIPIQPAERSLRRRLRIRAVAQIQGLPPFMKERLERQSIPALEGPYDLAVAEDDGALLLMPNVECPVVVHRHNVFSQTIAGLLRSDQLGFPRKVKWAAELPMWRRFDRLLVQRSDHSLVTTPEAAEALLTVVPGTSVHVVQNGADVPSVGLIPGEQPRVVFVGTMSYEPNADGAIRFGRDVWPIVQKAVPGATLDLIGYDPLPAVRSLAGGGISVLGSVPDVLQACQGARVAVVPLWSGSGIKTKTLEMLSLGLPVVATAMGAEGIPASPQDGLLIGRSNEELARSTIDLLTDLPRARAVGAAARRFIQDTYSWETATDHYVRVLHEIAGNEPKP